MVWYRRKASANLRTRLTTLEPLLADKTVQPQVLCYSAHYLQCKLALTSWLVTRAWQPFVGVKGQAKLDDSFKRFCDIMLGRSAAELKAAFNHRLNDDEYPEQLLCLTRHPSAFTLLSGLTPTSKPNLTSPVGASCNSRWPNAVKAGMKPAVSRLYRMRHFG